MLGLAFDGFARARPRRVRVCWGCESPLTVVEPITCLIDLASTKAAFLGVGRLDEWDT
jgi:hypothetical protein